MTDESKSQITRILAESSKDPRRSGEELLPLVYEELRQLARARMAREAEGQTLQATALVHEAFMRLVGEADPGWHSRGHFFGAAALAMRRILVEQARRKARLRHGGGRARLDVDEVEVEAELPGEDVLVVEEAVQRLEQRDSRKGQIINLRYYAGLTAEETAHALGVSLGTVEREWRFIKAWLRVELEGPGDAPH